MLISLSLLISGEDLWIPSIQPATGRKRDCLKPRLRDEMGDII